MLRTSLFFFFVAILATIFADIEITTLQPWQEIGRIFYGALTPDFVVVLSTMSYSIVNTIVFALCGTFGGFLLGILLVPFFSLTWIRVFCSFLRSIHEIFWVFIFLAIVGLNPICGVLSIAIPYGGIFAKVYAEILQEANQQPLQALPVASSKVSRFFYGILPVVYADVRRYTSYRFECALRSTAVLGFVGLPTIGYYLETAFREGMYSEAAALLYLFYLLIASLPYWVKPKLVLVYVALAFFLLSDEITFSIQNVIRFFTYEILPWPMRREGVLDGSFHVQFEWQEIVEWMLTIWQESALAGIWNTLVLTQMALVGTGIFTLVTCTLISHHFSQKWTQRFGHSFLIVMRTTPEYILAYLFVLLWGPSMLPCVFALALHNGAILGFLSGQHMNLLSLAMDSSAKKVNRYFFEVLPRIYGHFLAFLFYRWEIMMRESAILGILGVYTLGFYIDSAISDDHLDTAMFLILITALLNMVIDSLSQTIRKRLKVSTKLKTAS